MYKNQLGKQFSDAKLDEFIKAIDEDNSGTVDKEEYKNFCRFITLLARNKQHWREINDIYYIFINLMTIIKYLM